MTEFLIFGVCSMVVMAWLKTPVGRPKKGLPSEKDRWELLVKYPEAQA